MFLNGAGALKFQAACASLMAALSVALAFALVPTLGVTGAAVAMVIAQGLLVLAPSAVYVARLLARMSARHSVLATRY
jgi:Na+-driven multidrug efflux pump